MSGWRRPLAVVWSGDIHVFARANDFTLWHWWSDGHDWWGPVSLGGTLVSDPLPAPGQSVTARCTGNTLQRWSWDGGQFRMRGPERLPGALATPPAAAGDWLITRSVEGRLLRWWRTGADWRGPEPLGPPDIGTSLNRVAFDPALAADEAGSYHAFWRTQADRRLVWWSWDPQQSQWRPASRLGTQALASDPVVLPSPGRLDVYAPGDDGRLWHWGRESGQWWPINPPEQEPRGARAASDPVLVAMADGRRDIFARAPDGALAHWWRSEGWDMSAGMSTWKEGTRGRLRASDPAAVAVSGGRQLVVFALDHDGALLHWQRTPPDDHHPTEPGYRETWHLHDGPDWYEEDFWTGPSRVVTTAHARPARWQDADPPAGVPTDPQFLLYRPDDLVLLGIRWSGLAVVAAGRGEFPALRATSGDARLVATLPPQHLGEQVRPEGQHPPVPRHWQARLAGPSRVVVQVTGQEPIPLTPSGLLAALSAGEVVPGTAGSGAEQTAIELPWQLLMSPVAGAPAAPIRAHHPAGPVASSDAAVGLWQTRLRAGDHHPVAGGAGLGYLPLRVGGAEPFDVPLPRAGRQLVRSQGTPAQLDRLELSALGGSVSVHGRWDTFEWEHEAALGRDLRVRTLARGVLYPLGHRAEYVELTVRRYEEPWALLVKERAIVVTEPVRTGLDSRAFPFSEVELTTHVFTDLRTPNWWSQERPVTALAQLEAQLEQHRRESLRLWSGLQTHLATTVEQRAATEPAVAGYLRVQDEIALTRDAIAALTHADPADRSVPVFCWPHRRRGGLVRFPVRCGGGLGEVRFDLPLIFVSDVAEPATPLLGAFSSLGNDAIAGRLAGAYAGTDPHDGVTTPAGEVTVPGTPVRLADGQVHEVHELNVAGQLDGSGSGFRPRLGSGPGGRAESRWACRLELPELRTLLSDHRRVPVRYADRYEHGDSVKIPLVVAGPAIDVDFAGRKERSGGLVAPSFALTGLHRDYGLVNSGGVESLSPADLFTGDATLLGFDLAALVSRITEPPAITSRQEPGQPPVIEMRWERVPVDSYPPLRSNGSTLTLRVTQAGDQAETYCEVTSFSLLLPPADPVLELSFERLAFTQQPGRQPVLDLVGVSTRFLGDLRLLQLLQEKVGLGTATPGIEASSSGIVARYALPVPDARAGAFVMTNLAFHAAVEVPFRGGAPVVSLGFASRERPFTLSVLMFGGGGYADLAVDHQGLRRLEIALEFGGYVAVDFVVARAQVHALGGIRFEVAGGRVALTGYLRIGGSVELLGLISVAVELTVQLTFREPNDLVGRATLVLEVDLLLYSTSVELDTGEWVIHGGGTERAAALTGPALTGPALTGPALTGPARAGGMENWQRYWGAFR